MGRAKEQWLEETGGFRIGESPEEFQARAEEIHRLRKLSDEGKASPADLEKLMELAGDQNSEI